MCVFLRCSHALLYLQATLPSPTKKISTIETEKNIDEKKKASSKLASMKRRDQEQEQEQKRKVEKVETKLVSPKKEPIYSEKAATPKTGGPSTPRTGSDITPKTGSGGASGPNKISPKKPEVSMDM